ncbi:MAG TPA: DUF1707 domain-containing protein [Solirubrobacteraceae bacterium]|nr:DUF1707 domain-containing protein [Solirubrobacteraceae bacterium]
MPLSDADRERLFTALSEHAAQDTISLEELERRIERVTAAQTREEAAAVLSDLPPLTIDAPAPEPSRARGRRGHGHSDAPDPSWRPTSERFRDPRTGAVMRVWEDASGGRHYVPE